MTGKIVIYLLIGFVFAKGKSQQEKILNDLYESNPEALDVNTKIRIKETRDHHKKFTPEKLRIIKTLTFMAVGLSWPVEIIKYMIEKHKKINAKVNEKIRFPWEK